MVIINNQYSDIIIHDDIDLFDIINQIKFQIAYTNNLEEFEKDKTLRAIRDGNCTHIIKNLRLNASSKDSVLKITNNFLKIASEINSSYFSCLNKQLKSEYFYVYRFVSLPKTLYGRNILYPSLISTSWNFNFVHDWALDDLSSFRKGMIQKIKVPRNCNFLTSSFPIELEVWEETEIHDKKYYMKIEHNLIELFKNKNDFVKNGIGKCRNKYELINQLEGEVVLPPGKMIYKKMCKLNELDIYEYEFIETPFQDIVTNINYCINEGTIL